MVLGLGMHYGSCLSSLCSGCFDSFLACSKSIKSLALPKWCSPVFYLVCPLCMVRQHIAGWLRQEGDLAGSRKLAGVSHACHVCVKA